MHGFSADLYGEGELLEYAFTYGDPDLIRWHQKPFQKAQMLLDAKKFEIDQKLVKICSL